MSIRFTLLQGEVRRASTLLGRVATLESISDHRELSDDEADELARAKASLGVLKWNLGRSFPKPLVQPISEQNWNVDVRPDTHTP